jgi:hypothetical protein
VCRGVIGFSSATCDGGTPFNLPGGMLVSYSPRRERWPLVKPAVGAARRCGLGDRLLERSSARSPPALRFAATSFVAWSPPAANGGVETSPDASAFTLVVMIFDEWQNGHAVGAPTVS